MLGGVGRCWEVLGGVGRDWEGLGGVGRDSGPYFGPLSKHVASLVDQYREPKEFLTFWNLRIRLNPLKITVQKYTDLFYKTEK